MKILQRLQRLIYLLRHPLESVPEDYPPMTEADWNADTSYSVVWGYGWRDLFKHLK
jgi:hypothetical protein